MDRRDFLRVSGGTAVGSIGFSTTGTAAQDSRTGENFFTALRGVDDVERAILDCSNTLCMDIEAAESSPNEVVQNADDTDHHIRRARFGIRILNEYNISTTIKPRTLARAEDITRSFNGLIPVIGSFNNMKDAACRVRSNPGPDSVKGFLYASLAFGLEIALWQSTAPYRMAWTATGFASTRTFLRYAKYRCNGCIAFAMSELHWALRAVPYNIVSESRIEFVWEEIQRLKDEVAQMDDIDVDLNVTREEIIELVGNPRGGAVVGFVPSNRGQQDMDSTLIGLGIIGGLLWILKD